MYQRTVWSFDAHNRHATRWTVLHCRCAGRVSRSSTARAIKSGRPQADRALEEIKCRVQRVMQVGWTPTWQRPAQRPARAAARAMPLLPLPAAAAPLRAPLRPSRPPLPVVQEDEHLPHSGTVSKTLQRPSVQQVQVHYPSVCISLGCLGRRQSASIAKHQSLEGRADPATLAAPPSSSAAGDHLRTVIPTLWHLQLEGRIFCPLAGHREPPLHLASGRLQLRTAVFCCC